MLTMGFGDEIIKHEGFAAKYIWLQLQILTNFIGKSSRCIIGS